ncbi:MAG TPA: DsbE family thiol:disulfide interchange protein [Burkholderiaceae bacterium]|nr:DsbE family thiol:disulfide interchange protein [Burkholderiaceae bacterium]
MKRWPFILPLVVIAILFAFFGVGLKLNPREVPSPLIDKPAPAFSLPRLDEPGQRLGRDDLRGQVWLLNVWASWCVACREEHPLLVEFARRKLVPIYGLNYKDQRPDAQRWLANFGNPYTASVSDLDGKVGIDFGVYGVPETFVIDKGGTIRFKQIGPITPEVLKDRIEPLIRKLQAENAANPA